jgi:hypothetical protein
MMMGFLTIGEDTPAERERFILRARTQISVTQQATDNGENGLRRPGGATGPLLNWIAISLDDGCVYAAFAAATAFMPVIWWYWVFAHRAARKCSFDDSTINDLRCISRSALPPPQRG